MTVATGGTPAPPGGGGRGASYILIGLVVLIALLLAGWLIFGRGLEDEKVDVDVPGISAVAKPDSLAAA